MKFIRKNWIAATALGLLAVTMLDISAFAQESKKEPVIYSPEHCEFSVTFPSEPHQENRCEDESREKCYNLVSYTQVFDMAATVGVHVICNPATEDLYNNYSGAVMEATVRAMTEKSVVKTFDTSFREEDGYKQAGLVGEGKTGMIPTVYIAQLWIGKKSVMSVEAEMTGEAYEEADKLFSTILKSVHYKGDAEKEKSAEKLKEERKEEKDSAE